MTREEAIQLVYAVLGRSEFAEIVLDYLEDCWTTLDELVEIFGGEQARNLLLAHSCLASSDCFSEQADDGTSKRESAHPLWKEPCLSDR
jgi:hypothetical protein